MKNFIKNIPGDVRQAIYSLCVAVGLISGSLLMLGSYLSSIEADADVGVMATPEPTETESPKDDQSISS